MNQDKNFISIFNEWYPFERYIVKNPKSIGNLFDEAILLEIFVPSTEIKPILDKNGNFTHHIFSSLDEDEIYVKIKGPSGEMRMAYYDFEGYIRENIRNIVLEEFGDYEWQSLYVEYDEEDDYDDLKEVLLEQYKLIKEKYGICNIKKYVDIPPSILKSLK